MKQSGQALVLFIIVFAGLLMLAAFLIHWPGARPVLEHLHGPMPAIPTAADDGAEPDAAARARASAAALGRRWDEAAFEQTVALYTTVHRDLEWPGLLDAETITYGQDPQQNFELFRPEQDFSEPGPVFVFVHGNGLGAGDWRIPGSDGLLLTHAGRLAATVGGIGVLMNYRTGVSATPGSGAEDLRLVVEWLQKNIAPYGGDPETVVVLGHSEGATLTATYLFDEDAQPATGPGIAAAVLSSGLFGEAAPRLPVLVETYGGQRVPLALWSAEFDTEAVESNIVEFHRQLCAKFPDCPWYERLDGYNHMSQLFSFGTSDTTVMNAFVRFYHTVR